MESLETRPQVPSDFKKALGQLPSELAGLYDIIHSQIERTEPYGQEVAIWTLSWLLCAQRLLSAEELIAAVYILDNNVSSDSDDDAELNAVGSPKDDILQLCRNLIVFDSEQDIFRFAHQSVREYLMKESRYTTVEQHTLAIERCLEIYLTKLLQDPITWQTKRQNAILKRYAEIYWPVHYKYAEDSTAVELTNKFFRFIHQIQGTSPPYVEWRSDILQENGGRHSWNIDRNLLLDADDHLGYRILWAASHPDILLGLASAFGFSSLLEAIQLSSTEVNESLALYKETYTLLSFAASEGHNHVVQLLLDKGADAHALNGLALQEAALRGQTQILETLLYQGSIDTNDLPRLFKKDLPKACRSGNVSTVRLLLERGANVNARDKDYGNALEEASFAGHDEIVQLLLDCGADVNASGTSGRNTLQEACYKGHDSIVKLLLDHGADVNGAGGIYGDALQTALNGGHDHIALMLLDRGADIKDVHGEALQRLWG